MTDFDGIRKEVAIEHNLLLEKDDPALLIVTMSERVFEKYVEILLEKQMAHMKALEAAQQKGIADAKVIVGRVITDGAKYTSDHAGDRVRIVIDEALVQIKKELGKVRQEIKLAKQTAVAAAYVACSCAVATVVAVAINII